MEPSAGFNSDVIIYGFTEPLLAAQIFSVVCTETWPDKNWICSNSPPESWHNRAQDLLRSCGANLEIPSRAAYCFTTCQTTFSVISVPQTVPFLQTRRKSLPCFMSAALSQWSSVSFTQSGIGTVLICEALPTRSTIGQCSSRR